MQILQRHMSSSFSGRCLTLAHVRRGGPFIYSVHNHATLLTVYVGIDAASLDTQGNGNIVALSAQTFSAA